MGKIKSALELAMERTAGLNHTAAGQGTTFDRDSYLKAANNLARSYMAQKTALDRVSESITRYPAEIKDQAITAFLKQAVRDLDFYNCRLFLQALRRLHPKGAGSPAAATLEKSYRNSRDLVDQYIDRARQGGREALLNELRQDGISGTAIGRINPEAPRFWKHTESRAAAEFAAGLEKIKTALQETL